MTFINRHKIPILLFLLGILLFANTLDSKLLFSWDDNRYLAENQLVLQHQFGRIFTEAYFGSYIPVTLLSYALEHIYWGLHPTGYHAVNITLHAINGVLVFFFLFLLTGQRAVSVIAAVLFIIHPVQVESVAWVAQRKNLLSMFFFLLAFIYHIRSRQQGSVKLLWTAWLFFLLSVLSKPAVVGAPILFMAYDYFWARISVRRTILSAIVPLAIAVFGAAAILFTSAEVGGIKAFWGGSRWAATQLTFLTTWENLLALILPTHLSPHYIYFPEAIQGNWRVWAGLLILLGFSGLGLYSLWRFMRDKSHKPVTFFLYLWVLAFMLPVSNIVPIAIQRSDRHLYFPSVLLFLMVGLLISWLWQRYQDADKRYVLVGGMTAVVVFFSSITIKQNEVWADSGTLWTYHLQQFPKDDIAVNNLAMFYFRTKQYEMANQVYVELARMTPDNYRPYLFQGLIAIEQEHFDDAIRLLRQAMPLADPELRESIQSQLLTTYAEAITRAKAKGQLEDIVDYCGEVIALIPDNPSIYNDLGDAYRDLGQMEAATEAYNHAIAIAPDYYPIAHANLGLQYLKMGLLDQAQAVFMESLAKQPTALAASGQCQVLIAKKDNEKALEACYLAVVLAPDSAQYADQLVHALLDTYNAEEALKAATKRLSDYPELLHPVLGHIYEKLGRHKAAIEQFQKSNSPLSQLKLGEVALAVKDFKVADDAFVRVLAEQQGLPEAVGGRCLALQHMGDAEHALSSCQSAIKLMPKETRLLMAYADLLTEQDRSHEAIEYYQKALENGATEAGPKLAAAYFQLGRSIESKGLEADALKLYRRAISFNPNQKEYQNRLGEILLKQRRHIEAIGAFNAAIELDPEFASAYANKGIAAFAAGEKQTARMSFERALEIDAELPSALSGYCDFLKATGGEADTICSKAAKL